MYKRQELLRALVAQDADLAALARVSDAATGGLSEVGRMLARHAWHTASKPVAAGARAPPTVGSAQRSDLGAGARPVSARARAKRRAPAAVDGAAARVRVGAMSDPMIALAARAVAAAEGRSAVGWEELAAAAAHCGLNHF